jgi:hypothetical protein
MTIQQIKKLEKDIQEVKDFLVEKVNEKGVSWCVKHTGYCKNYFYDNIIKQKRNLKIMTVFKVLKKILEEEKK